LGTFGARAAGVVRVLARGMVGTALCARIGESIVATLRRTFARALVAPFMQGVPGETFGPIARGCLRTSLIAQSLALVGVRSSGLRARGRHMDLGARTSAGPRCSGAPSLLALAARAFALHAALESLVGGLASARSERVIATRDRQANELLDAAQVRHVVAFH